VISEYEDEFPTEEELEAMEQLGQQRIEDQIIERSTP